MDTSAFIPHAKPIIYYPLPNFPPSSISHPLPDTPTLSGLELQCPLPLALPCVGNEGIASFEFSSLRYQASNPSLVLKSLLRNILGLNLGLAVLGQTSVRQTSISTNLESSHEESRGNSFVLSIFDSPVLW